MKMIGLVRTAHVVAAVYNLLFVYTALHAWQYGFFTVQYISMPVLLVSGVAMVRLRKAGAA